MSSSHDSAAQPISLSEWAELRNFRPVIEGWGLTDETPEEIANFIYGVKFDFVSGMPGFAGDLFILKGDSLSAPPIMIGRIDNELVALDYDR